MAFVGDQLDVSLTDMTGAIESFTRRIPQIEKGTSESAKAFQALGVNLRDSHGNLRDMGDLFPDIISSLSEMDNETARNAVATQIFGRRAIQLVPLLDAGGAKMEELTRKARDMGLVMSDDAVAGLVAWKDQTAALRDQLGAITRSLAVAFLPAIKKVTDFVERSVVPRLRSFAEWLKNIRPETLLVASGIAGIAASIGPMLLGVSAAISAYKGLSGALVALSNPITATILIVGTLGAAAYTLYQNWDAVKVRLSLIWAAIKSAVFGAVDGILGALEKLTGWLPGVGDKVRQLRSEFDAWADESLARSNDQIIRLERELADNFEPTATSAADTVAALGDAFQAAADQAGSFRAQVGQVSRIEAPELDLAGEIPVGMVPLHSGDGGAGDSGAAGFNAGRLAPMAQRVLSGGFGAQQLGSSLGGLAGSFLPVPGASLITSKLGGMLGGLFGGKDEARQHPAIRKLDAIERAQKETVKTIKAQTDALLKPADRLINLPSTFTPPGYRPQGGSVTHEGDVHVSMHFEVHTEQDPREVQRLAHEGVVRALRDGRRRASRIGSGRIR